MHFSTGVVALCMALVSGRVAQAQEPTDPINFGIFSEVTECARNQPDHIESHEQGENGRCIRLDWPQSFAFKAAFNHTSCQTKFYSDDACSTEIPAPQPFTDNLSIDNYYTSCYDNVMSLNPPGHTGAVPTVNVTVTCV